MRFQTLQDVLGFFKRTTFFQSVLTACFLLQIIWIHIDAQRERRKKESEMMMMMILVAPVFRNHPPRLSLY
jgi:hypothetical protein